MSAIMESTRVTDVERFASLTLRLARAHGAHQSVLDQLHEFLTNPVTRRVLDMDEQVFEAYLVNDVYKPRMHKMYAEFMTGVTIDFKLRVRRSEITLADIRESDPELWHEFEKIVGRRLSVPPYPPLICETLRSHFFGFEVTESMAERARKYSVAAVTWRLTEGNELEGWTHGTAEAASHVETTLTQAVEELVVAAQLRRVQNNRTKDVILPLPSGQLLLASALVRLALGVAGLNESHRVHGIPMLLFSGRRASSRRYLVLQNWYCGRYLTGWRGCSCVLAAAILDRAVRESIIYNAEQERRFIGPLAGTLAHEVVMVVDQLLTKYNELKPATTNDHHHQTSSTPTPNNALAQVTSLLAHLVFLLSTDRVSNACALPDTLGTRGFVSAALAARLPAAFVEECSGRYPDDWAQAPVIRFPHPDGQSTVFDLFTTWRIDSGDYAEMASVVVDAWEARWEAVPEQHRPPRPQLINSNLEDWDEIVDIAGLPARIRPTAFAFGTLADGFLPVDAPFRQEAARMADGTHEHEEEVQQLLSHVHAIKLCSVVMKAVQASHPGIEGAASAIKLGDGGSESKLEYDTRIPEHDLDLVKARARELSKPKTIDSDAISASLASAYDAIVHQRVLC